MTTVKDWMPRIECHRHHIETMLVCVRIYIAHPELREGAEDPGPLTWEERAQFAEKILVHALTTEKDPEPELRDVMDALQQIAQILDNGVCAYGSYD